MPYLCISQCLPSTTSIRKSWHTVGGPGYRHGATKTFALLDNSTLRKLRFQSAAIKFSAFTTSTRNRPVQDKLIICGQEWVGHARPMRAFSSNVSSSRHCPYDLRLGNLKAYLSHSLAHPSPCPHLLIDEHQLPFSIGISRSDSGYCHRFRLPKKRHLPTVDHCSRAAHKKSSHLCLGPLGEDSRPPGNES